MILKIKWGFICIGICLFNLNVLFAQKDLKYPVPTGNPNQLFYLQRDPNINTLVYELNYKNGAFVADDPVHVYWVRYTEKGQHEELNYIQRNFAYGIKSRMLEKDSYELHFVSYKKKLLYLKKSLDNKFSIYTDINKKRVILRQIFIRVNGGTFWLPNIEYVELKGIDPATGLEVVERMKI